MTNPIRMIGIALMLCLCAATIVIYFVKAPARAAYRNLTAINGITVGQTTEADLLRRPAFQKLDATCFAGECLYYLEAQNSLLSLLHLSRRMHLATVVKVRDGMVSGVSVIGWREGMPALSLNQMADSADCGLHPCIRQLRLPNKALVGIRLEFDNQSEIRNHMPDAIDSTCLSRLHGCETDPELMPILRETGYSSGAR